MADRIRGQIVRVEGPIFLFRDNSGRCWRSHLRGRLWKGDLRASVPACIGDEVEISPAGGDQAFIEHVLERRTYLVRQAPLGGRRSHGKGPSLQLLAANVEAAVVVIAAPRARGTVVDRFLAVVRTGGVRAVLCLNKVDLVPAAERERLEELAASYRRSGVAVVLTSALTGEGVDELASLLRGQLVTFLGPSGTGKSSLLNALCPGLQLRTGEVDALGRGRHTTSWAAIYDIGWARVVDTPGLREIGFAEASAASDDVLGGLFPDIGELAKGCRFRDCSHTHEPGCAVKVALEAGELDEARYRQFVKLQRALNR